MTRAYENLSLPIGHKQTISQPYIVAKMTELIHETTSMNNVLEIGTDQVIRLQYYLCCLKKLQQ